MAQVVGTVFTEVCNHIWINATDSPFIIIRVITISWEIFATMANSIQKHVFFFILPRSPASESFPGNVLTVDRNK